MIRKCKRGYNNDTREVAARPIWTSCKGVGKQQLHDQKPQTLRQQGAVPGPSTYTRPVSCRSAVQRRPAPQHSDSLVSDSEHRVMPRPTNASNYSKVPFETGFTRAMYLAGTHKYLRHVAFALADSRLGNAVFAAGRGGQMPLTRPLALVIDHAALSKRRFRCAGSRSRCC